MEQTKNQQLFEIAAEMQRIYFANERHLDEQFWAERLGLDNVTGNLDFYDLDWYTANGQQEQANKILADMKSFFQEIERLADIKGYGPNAAARGFDVTRPIGRYWTLARKALRLLES